MKRTAPPDDEELGRSKRLREASDALTLRIGTEADDLAKAKLKVELAALTVQLAELKVQLAEATNDPASIQLARLEKFESKKFDLAKAEYEAEIAIAIAKVEGKTDPSNQTHWHEQMANARKLLQELR